MFDINKINQNLLTFFSKYLNDYSDLITKEQIDEVIKSGVSECEAFYYLLTSYMNIDPELESFIIREYLSKIIKCVDINNYINNPYYKNVKLDNVNNKNWEIKKTEYKPYEAFVSDDMYKTFDGKLIPQIGYFKEKYSYYAIYQNDREWMSIKPNEINTMAHDISLANGRVLVCGLGMAYFAYMIALKEDVKSIDIIEIDDVVIDLYNNYLKDKLEGIDTSKINIIKADAYSYLKSVDDIYDFIYIDLWHDVSDGKEMYLKMKTIEQEKNIKATWRYWIEKTIKLYL